MITTKDLKEKGFIQAYKIHDRVGYSKGRVILKFIPDKGMILDMTDFSDVHHPKTLATNLNDKKQFDKLHETINY